MKKYKVKVLDPSKLLPSQTTNGYLSSAGAIQMYTRGEAIKKARAFNGKMELVGLSTVLSEVRMIQIPENALLDAVVKHLKGREAFKDTESDLDERIYTGDVFEAIASEYAEVRGKGIPDQYQKVLDQLDELATLIDTEYVQIVKR